MRSIAGQGYAGLEKFTTTMNLPSPMTKKNYNASGNVITKAVTEVAKKTMHDAAKEIVSSTASQLILVFLLMEHGNDKATAPIMALSQHYRCLLEKFWMLSP